MKQIVETPSQTNVLCDLFNNIYFEFDKTEITPKAATIIDEIAQIMLTDTSKNISSQDVLMQRIITIQYGSIPKRADAVVNALIKKGVPNKMLKAKEWAQKYRMHLRMLPTKYEKEIVKL